ncbi:MAG: hypothetical protein ACRD5H_15325, partial [Nitrososphaerales archaeon]
YQEVGNFRRRTWTCTANIIDDRVILDWDPQDPRRRGSAITPLPDLKTTLGDLLTGGCGDWVKKLINQAGENAQNLLYDDNVLNILDKVNSMGGITLADFQIRGVDALPGDGRAVGSIFAGNAGIIIAPFRSAAGRLSEARAKIQAYGYTITALHELIHHSSHMTFSDQQLAQAAVDVGGLSPEELEQWNNLNKNDAIETSRFWQNLLQKHCPMKE